MASFGCTYRSVKRVFQVLLIISIILKEVWPEHLLASFKSEIGAGNYTYYSLHQDGFITMILTSLTGDADLYVSAETQRPDYSNYDLVSATCGVDIVHIPADMKRPAGVGVYGHIHQPLSQYKLIAVQNYSGTYTDSKYSTFTVYEDNVNNRDYDGKHSVFSSLMWDFLELIIKVLAEVLV